MSIPRYKIVVQVSIGEVKNQTVRVTSKCLWDSENDNYCSVTSKNVQFVLKIERNMGYCYCFWFLLRINPIYIIFLCLSLLYDDGISLSKMKIYSAVIIYGK